ncbi:MAG: TetR/AcrR family transcriptional regulator [Nevskia sp.]|nr:TetR/AcrR family transcriptional regulator [Nevskia sp.]
MATPTPERAARHQAGPPSLPLRERQRLARRERLLDAAEALLRQSGGTEFSMVLLAERAEMSQTTPYALFGSKAAILYAVLNRALARARAAERRAAAAEPLEQVLDMVDTLTRSFAAESAFYRPLWRALLGADEPESRAVLLKQSAKLWRNALEPAHARGLPDFIDADHLARELMIHALGITTLWVQNEIGDEPMRANYALGTALLLLTVAHGAERERILKRMQRARKLLPVVFGDARLETVPRLPGAIGGK